MPALDNERQAQRRISDWNVGTNIKHLRTVKDIEQQTLARYVGMAQSQLSRIESGTRTLKFQEGMAIAKILGVRPERLIQEVIDNAAME
jgi:transcriptional regulator with XRE-family HTH domain